MSRQFRISMSKGGRGCLREDGDSLHYAVHFCFLFYTWVRVDSRLISQQFYIKTISNSIKNRQDLMNLLNVASKTLSKYLFDVKGGKE